jgi:hypothetical protein
VSGDGAGGPEALGADAPARLSQKRLAGARLRLLMKSRVGRTVPTVHPTLPSSLTARSAPARIPQKVPVTRACVPPTSSVLQLIPLCVPFALPPSRSPTTASLRHPPMSALHVPPSPLPLPFASLPFASLPLLPSARFPVACYTALAQWPESSAGARFRFCARLSAYISWSARAMRLASSSPGPSIAAPMDRPW